jgi:protein-S-isoprenylcysteine O-methyltransferase Ste14
VRSILQRAIRPSTTRSTVALWAKSLLNAVLFFVIFMLALPGLAHHLVPMELPFPSPLRTWIAGVLAIAGIGAWIACLDTFSRSGRGTPLPADAPRHLVTQGLFRHLRNPIMAAELAVIWAEALYLASVGAVVYATLITVAAHLLVVYVEEPELRSRFGQSYIEYCESVPRWFPRLSRQP